jgi:hypothetical protein
MLLNGFARSCLRAKQNGDEFFVYAGLNAVIFALYTAL